MTTLTNAELITQVVEALFRVAGRRTLMSFAIQVIRMVVNKLEPDYGFLRQVDIQDALYSEGGVKVTVNPILNTVDSDRIVSALDAMIRVVYLNLLDTPGDDVGPYFVTELKENLGDDIVQMLHRYGMNFELIQSDQHDLYKLRDRKPVLPSRKDKEEEPKARYTWDTVSTWKYENNVCFLYDGQGKLLDTLQLDLIIEDYIKRVSEKIETVSSPTIMLRVSEKEEHLLEMLRERDMDMEYVLDLFHVSRQKLETMIHKLLQLEMLQHISEKEVKLTDKGLQYLSERNKEL